MKAVNDILAATVDPAQLLTVRNRLLQTPLVLARLPSGWEEHWIPVGQEYERYYLHEPTGEVRQQGPPPWPRRGPQRRRPTRA